MKYACVIIEDEPPAMDKLKSFIGRVPFLSLSAAFFEPFEALNFLQNSSADILFLDIQMEHLTGIELLESLPMKPAVIITTAYSEFALKGYELQVSDYLLKPYSFDRFLKAVNHTIAKIIAATPIVPSPQYVFLKTAYKIERVVVSDILYIEGMKDYLGVVTIQKRYMCLQSFQNMLDLLPSNAFCRTHKSFIVAIQHIESIEHHRIKIGEKLIPISVNFRTPFYAFLANNQMLF